MSGIGVCRESEFPPTEELNASAELGQDVDKKVTQFHLYTLMDALLGTITEKKLDSLFANVCEGRI